MSDTSKTVFISYRRETSWAYARLIYNDLRAHGFDVFMDVENIDSGEFKKIIQGEIRAREHFIIILAPGSTKRFREKGDWLLEEIRLALKEKRNIVPVFVSDFNFEDFRADFTNGIEALPRFNGLPLNHEFFDAGMQKLRDRFLTKLAKGEIRPTPEQDRPLVEEKIEQADNLPQPEPNELRAEEIVGQAEMYIASGDYEAAIAKYTQGIEINPKYQEAYSQRGIVYAHTKQFDLAVEDFTRAIELNPADSYSYMNRGNIYSELGDVDMAIVDLSRAIELEPDLTIAFYNRAYCHHNIQNYDEAIRDFTQAIELNPDLTIAYYYRGIAYVRVDDSDAAIADLSHLIQHNPQDFVALYHRAVAYFTKSQFELAHHGFQECRDIKNHKSTIAGLAISLQALGKIEEARKRWRRLLRKDKRFRDIEWIKRELYWPDPLIEEARKLIAGLDE